MKMNLLVDCNPKPTGGAEILKVNSNIANEI